MRTTKRGRPAVAIAIVVGTLGSANLPATLAAPGDIYNLGTLDTSPAVTFSQGFGINDAGQVAGVSVTGELDPPSGDPIHHAFRYTGTPGSGGAMVDLGALGETYSSGYGINNSGEVAGYSLTTGGTWHAFRYSGTPGAGGTMADLGSLGRGSLGFGINKAGEVAGYFWTSGGNQRAFRYSGTPGAGGTMADLGTLGGTYSLGYGINDAGQVVGYSQTAGRNEHAFRYSGTPGAGGAMLDLGTLGGTTSVGQAINNAGQVTGYSKTTGDVAEHAFRYSGTPGAGGTMLDLGTLGGRYSLGWGINDAGFVVGHAYPLVGDAVATLWLTDAGNTPVDLDAWLDATNPTLGGYWALTEAVAINNKGLIVGHGFYGDGPGGLTDGTRAFILDASSLVPEPFGLTLLAAGALGLSRRRRRGIARDR